MKNYEIDQLRDFISAEARARKQRPDRYFVQWYSDLRRETEDTMSWITDGSDGEIDLVIEQKSCIVLAQLKYRKAAIHDLRAFERTIEQWSEESKFSSWLTHDVKNPQARKIYKEAFAAAKQKGKELVWEFISLTPHNTTWVDKAEAVGQNYPGLMRAEIISAQYLRFLHELERVGAKYSDHVDFQVDPNPLEVRHPKNFRTILLAMKIPSLLSGLRRHGNADALLARNVRLEIPNSSVNLGISDTYAKEPHKFFFGNNGIHIVTTQAKFIGDKIVLEQPAIINGGQTIKTLLNCSVSHREGEVLLRITEIPREYQATHEGRDFVGDIIFMSNNNNKMEPWNLRSNDPVQIAIAKHLHRNKIFYERKDFEWKHSRHRRENHDISVSLHSTELAAAIACTDDSINPAGLKEMGIAPLFIRESRGGSSKSHYNRIFGKRIQQLDETLSIARVRIIVDKWISKTPGIPEDFSGFSRAASGFVFGIIWRALEDYRLPHPYKLMPAYQKTCNNLGKVSRKIAKGLFEMYERDMKEHGVQQNDIFRDKKCWSKAMKRFLTAAWKRDIQSAVKKDILAA